MMRRRKMPTTQKQLAPVEETRPTVQIRMEMDTRPCLCPFCLHSGNIMVFEFQTPKGKKSGMYKCPECHNRMRAESLMQSQTAEEFAKWVFEYSADGFWQKTNFYTFNKRLKELGIATPFWNRYKELKGTKGETYFDYLDRSQQEQHESELHGETDEYH